MIKDLKLSIKAIIFIIFYIVVFSTITLSSVDKPFISVAYVLLMIMSIILLVIYTNGLDDRNKTEVVLNSLPISRSDIVRGKYLTVILYIVIICSMLFLSSNFLKGLITKFQGGKSITIGNIIVAINVVLLFYSIYYPVYFKVGEDMRTFNYVLWILLFVFPNLVKKLGNKLNEKGLLKEILSVDLEKVNICILIISIVVFYMSLQISKKLYKQREF